MMNDNHNENNSNNEQRLEVVHHPEEEEYVIVKMMQSDEMFVHDDNIHNNHHDQQASDISKTNKKNKTTATATLVMVMIVVVMSFVGLLLCNQTSPPTNILDGTTNEEATSSSTKNRRTLLASSMPSTTTYKNVSTDETLSTVADDDTNLVPSSNVHPPVFQHDKEKLEWFTQRWNTQQQEEMLNVATADNNNLRTNAAIDNKNLSVGSESNKKFFQDTVHVLQFGDEGFRHKYHDRSFLNQEYAKCNNYQYHLVDMEIVSEDCLHTNKVATIYNFFLSETINEGEWMIFIDLDAYVQLPNCNDLDRILLEQQQVFDQLHANQNNNNDSSEIPPTKCEVMFHMPAMVINTGVLIIKKTNDSIRLMEEWYQHQLDHGFCLGPGDQWAFQEILLKHYHLSGIQDCLALEKGPTTFSLRSQCSIRKLQTLKRESELHFFGNSIVTNRNNNDPLTVPKSTPTSKMDFYRQHHSTYSMVPLLGTTVNTDNHDNDSLSQYNNVCVFDCFSQYPLQCKGCNTDPIAKLLDTSGESVGENTCLEGNPPIFHHKRSFL